MNAEQRSRVERSLFDAIDALRATENGRPCPEHVLRRAREDLRASAKASAWRMIDTRTEFPQD